MSVRSISGSLLSHLGRSKSREKYNVSIAEENGNGQPINQQASLIKNGGGLSKYERSK